MNPKWIMIMLMGVTLSLLGASCDLTTNPPAGSVTGNVQYPNWTAVLPGVDFKQVKISSATGPSELFDVVRIDPQQQTIVATWDSARPQTVADWQRSLPASVIINGTYFDEQNLPTTQVIINNNKVGHWLSGNTGVLQSADQQTWQITATTTATPDTWLLQSYPVLFTKLQPILTSASVAVARRTVVATDQSGRVYWLVTEFGNLTLAQLANAVHNQLDLNLTSALNLDGGSSTGLIIQSPQLHYQTNSLAVPGVLYLPMQ